ncbi:hypothetical protein ACHQM5_009553 [Ranunculus cassubicifolius]
MSTTSAACPFCNRIFPLSELERHADNHLTEDEFQRDLDLACQLSCAPVTPCKQILSTSVSRTSTSDHEEAAILENISHLSQLQIRSTFYKVEGGLMILLRRCLELELGNTISFITDHVDHYQSLKSEDRGFGCGWRNIQMLSSHLLVQRPETREVLFGGSGFVPEIAFLQRWLEIAWERGFDISGSVDFNNQVYGSRKWIGTTECATLFRSFGLRARIVDFDRKEVRNLSTDNGANPAGKRSGGKHYRGKKQTERGFGPMDKFLVNKRNQQAQAADHERSNHSDSHPLRDSGDSTLKNYDKSINSDTMNKITSEGHQILMEWVWKYFSDNKSIDNVEDLGRVNISKKTPLYFQHQGHSRTIIGIQVRQQHGMPEQYTLLCFDPGHRTVDLEKSLRFNQGWQRLIKRGVHTLRKPQYQLCYIDPGIAHAKEMEQLKIIDSISC